MQASLMLLCGNNGHALKPLPTTVCGDLLIIYLSGLRRCYRQSERNPVAALMTLDVMKPHHQLRVRSSDALSRLNNSIGHEHALAAVSGCLSCSG
jgi:hypothetical protein